MKSNHLQEYIGQRIRTLRKDKGLSQQNLSEKAGVGIDYISNLETKGSNIKIDTLEKIVSALNITPSELFESRVNPQNPKLELLAEQLAQLPISSQEQLLEAFQLLIKTVKEKPNR
ncbi:helix-turn-helix domain-containing protein [Streptococcus iniae]|uniref:XRE family transcriptional regulator n=2 Tax=Streptococcus iniae TaxID=1346 RepID=A0A3L8GFY3_STRIN|nr:helix-turn-helix transcriptional regulator [Streptococcus iniae]AGM99628.1 XRE family transcriptional regulator [Streptococcus iniae SF1]AHY16541.1 XRE family transcriptional regulator [Streptococcus iniae]AHY18407.1 XRE family transcriptional regulator [Streptococcus iniae]AJG26673.1 XRE family transcriptional regulator [Streptococcus iniae]APD32566.1 transcriptional regulator [Streptococcus iniae]